MSVFVLVHGSWHGGWCWEGVAGLLEGRGHRVFRPDLPGHGADRTPPGEVTLESCAGRVANVLAGCAEPAFVVGHSFGGVVVSQAAELLPEAFAGSVYVCAFLLRHGQSVWRHGTAPPAAGDGTGSSVLTPENLLVNEQAILVDIRAAAKPDFYTGCPPEEIERGLDRWRPEPLAPLITPLALSEARFGRVPRTYVHCRDDRVIPIRWQERMCRLSPCATELTMDAGHSPFLSHPDELAELLEGLGT